jgi:hypothetical protein
VVEERICGYVTWPGDDDQDAAREAAPTPLANGALGSAGATRRR